MWGASDEYRILQQAVSNSSSPQYCDEANEMREGVHAFTVHVGFKNVTAIVDATNG